jgi:hypothetical protein
MDTIAYTQYIQKINSNLFYPKYTMLLRDNNSLDIIKKKTINFDDIIKVIVTTSTQAKLAQFKQFLMENQANFKEDGMVSRVKDFLGADQFPARMGVMAFDRLNVEKHIKLPHCVIFISGFTSEGSDGNEAWEGFTNKDDTCNFLAYNWEASTALEVGLQVLEQLPLRCLQTSFSMKITHL